MTQGFILGKFAPFHSGHVFLIEQARQQCDVLTILVESDEKETIPGWHRYHWVKSSFPNLDVRHLQGQSAGQFFEKFVAEASEGQQVVVFESGEKLKALAQSFGFQHIALDVERKTHPIFSAQIRENPWAFWDAMPPQVRSFYLKRIALVGPESCGKSYLAEQLAAHFQTAFVEEYGRTYCEKFGMDSTELDFAHVAGGQLYREDEMALEANRLLFCDTDLIVTQIWSEVYFDGKCQPWIFWANHARRYDLFLLCAPDIPWVNDGLREFESKRAWMFERLKQELESRGLRYVLIQGDFETRTQRAIEAIEALTEGVML